MKVIFCCLVFFYPLLTFGQQSASSKEKHLDTVLCLNFDCQQVLQVDSIDFLSIYLDFDERYITNNYNIDSIVHAQNRVADLLSLSQIDTLVIDGFLEHVNVFPLLNKIQGVKIIQLIGYNSIDIIKTNECSLLNEFRGAELLEVYASSLKIDLSALDYLGVKKMWIDVEQENKLDNILLLSNSVGVENVYLSYYFPKRKKFERRNRRKFENKDVFSIGHGFIIPRKTSGEWPHG